MRCSVGLELPVELRIDLEVEGLEIAALRFFEVVNNGYRASLQEVEEV